MIKRMSIMLLCLGLLFGLIFGFGAFKSMMIKKVLATLPGQPQAVSTIKAEKTLWQPNLQSVGNLVAINGADVSAQVAGIVDTLNFKSGETVSAGTTLLTLRPNNDPAVLAQLQATAALDKVNYNRDLLQFRANAVSGAQVDQDRASLLAAQAEVASQQEQMDEKVIKAPFAGVLGIRQVDLGQYLSAGTEIVTLQQLNPLYIDFYLPQQTLPHVKLGQPLTVSVDAFPDRTFSGTVAAINPLVDTASLTVEVRAQIDNNALLLRPGMFATINVAVAPPESEVTLPQTAVVYNPYGDTVYLVQGSPESEHVQQKFVKVGAVRGDQIEIVSGVAVGDIVVTAGQLKLHNGSKVTINNSVRIPDSASPNPPNE